ncbi:hypothetical protein Mrose_01635 [Calidithermus roseus]|uniref:Uncharacterized protein n=1 Tax=Calidithermus roseus TaxID=1644118 RepID=A0A399ES40_9DEIN|nr:hypothetical protein Mrose_01635 [Calidithermus roseus]
MLVCATSLTPSRVSRTPRPGTGPQDERMSPGEWGCSRLSGWAQPQWMIYPNKAFGYQLSTIDY